MKAPLTFFKAQKTGRGHCVSFKVDDRTGDFFLSMSKQTSWNDEKRTGTFANTREKPELGVNVKLSQSEVAGFIDAIKRNSEFKFYHDFNNKVTSGNFAPYKDKEGKPMGFSLFITKDANLGEKATKFNVGFHYNEAELLKIFLEKSLSVSFEAIDKSFSEKYESSKGSTGSGEKPAYAAKYKKKQEETAEGDGNSESGDDDPFSSL
jgi:hypothetical protein